MATLSLAKTNRKKHGLLSCPYDCCGGVHEYAGAKKARRVVRAREKRAWQREVAGGSEAC